MPYLLIPLFWHKILVPDRRLSKIWHNLNFMLAVADGQAIRVPSSEQFNCVYYIVIFDFTPGGKRNWAIYVTITMVNRYSNPPEL